MADESDVVRILFLAANPIDSARIRLDREASEIKKALRGTKFRDCFEWISESAVRVQDIQGHFHRHSPTIVHFSGHGSLANAIIVEDEDGASRLVSGEGLRSLFELVKGTVRCVVLNSCYSASQAQDIFQHIDCVIGMPGELDDEAAICFSRAFYQALGFGKDLEKAYQCGRAQLIAEHLAAGAMPELLLRGDGRIAKRHHKGADPASHPQAWNPPRTPDPFIGRGRDLDRVRAALGVSPDNSGVGFNIVSIHGVPGVGKSTLAAWLANDPTILEAFPDAVLWSAFGQFGSVSDSDFEIRRRLMFWASVLGDAHIRSSMRKHEIVDRLAILLRNRRALLICDDVWKTEHMAEIRRLADGHVRLLITSRLSIVAEKVVARREGVLELGVFSEEDAVSLLGLMAPNVVKSYPTQSRTLVQDLEFLPLAITVAGHLLRREMDTGLDVVALIEELREEGDRLLKEEPPVDMMELIREARSPTIATWLKRSTQLLDAEARECFVSLGHLAPKPATFGLNVLEYRWPNRDMARVIRTLFDAGLVQATSDGRYQIHALLITLARAMGKDDQLA